MSSGIFEMHSGKESVNNLSSTFIDKLGMAVMRVTDIVPLISLKAHILAR